MLYPGAARNLVSLTRVVLLSGLLLGALAARGQKLDRTDASRVGQSLGFEAELQVGWMVSPPETVTLDSQVAHSGKGAARVERRRDSPQQFSTLTQVLPMDFQGERLELRGFIRTEDVGNFVGLWMREDGETPNLAFDNMQKRGVKGTTDWTEYSITLPVHPDGRRLYFGFLMVGTGKAWVDDLQLLVDGKPIWEAPKAERVLTVLDRDQEFDAGSKISLTGLSPVQVANLATLGRVWGFLKYHHPKVTEGKLHWDYALFRILPKILVTPDQAGANKVLLQWIDGLGDLTAGDPPPALIETNLHLRPDLRWIEDEGRLGRDLGARLRLIHRHRPKAGGQFYVALAPNVGNPVFEREPAYPRITATDAGYQLLGLFRFWNIVRYWFPYRDLVEGDWDATLAEFIPRIGLAPDRDAYQREMMALIARVHDTHANLWSSLSVRPPVGEAQLPVAVRFVEGQAVVTQLVGSPAPTGLQVGDVITAIGGAPVEKLVRDWTPYYAASNEPTRLRDIARSLTRGPAGEVQLAVRRNGETQTITAARVPSAPLAKLIPRTHDLPGETFRLLSPEVAYLKLSSVKQTEAKSYIERAAGTKGLVVDIRNYPSEFMVFALGSLLVEQPTEFVRFTIGDLGNPGTFAFGRPLSLQPQTPHYTGKVVILLDEISQSSAEYTAMALRAAPKAKVIGSTTAGADGNVSRISLPGGLHTMISGIGVFYPDKSPTQRVGIRPDLEVKPTLAGIHAGRDEVLEAALREILGAEISDAEIQRLASPAR